MRRVGQSRRFCGYSTVNARRKFGAIGPEGPAPNARPGRFNAQSVAERPTPSAYGMRRPWQRATIVACSAQVRGRLRSAAAAVSNEQHAAHTT
ncbi:hypothetical protein AURDEDRAFT_117221 [Auricularia subglabra TFB-10046 SS5]|nr:hypothetical protein AURDEDRAFT_117221 [Auricularia subglabra TFB-10046 SS5]